MADDKMKNDDLNKNMGGAQGNQPGQGQQAPGRQQGDEQFGQKGGGQSGQGTPGNRGIEDDELGQGGGDRGTNPGGQNPREPQNR